MNDDDLEWYLDNIIVPSGPERERVGPARQWQAAWDAAERVLLEDSSSAAERLACGQGFVLTSAQARRCGLRDADLRRFVYRHTWTVPRRGVLSVLAPSDAVAPHGLRPEVRAAAVAIVRPGTVLSHESAAAAWGLPVLDEPTRPTLTVARPVATCGRDNARIHAAALDGDVARWFGVGITTPARTAIDLARARGAGAGLAAADAALREGLATPQELAAARERASSWPGARAAHTVVGLASPLVESALESLARLCLHENAVPLPELQVWVNTAKRRYRVDGLWRDRDVILEVDGMLKYKAPGRLAAEKRRQEDLERAGYRVVRILWDDVMNRRAETVERVREALRSGGYRRAYGSR